MLARVVNGRAFGAAGHDLPPTSALPVARDGKGGARASSGRARLTHPSGAAASVAMPPTFPTQRLRSSIGRRHTHEQEHRNGPDELRPGSRRDRRETRIGLRATTRAPGAEGQTRHSPSRATAHRFEVATSSDKGRRRPTTHRGATHAAVSPVVELRILLDRVADSGVERGTPAERRLLEVMSEVSAPTSWGASAALVDWDGTETGGCGPSASCTRWRRSL